MQVDVRLTVGTLARVPGKGTPKRSIRVPDALWQAALTIAKRRGETLNAVLRGALERYVAEDRDSPRKQP